VSDHAREVRFMVKKVLSVDQERCFLKSAQFAREGSDHLENPFVRGYLSLAASDKLLSCLTRTPNRNASIMFKGEPRMTELQEKLDALRGYL
jgi:hypothetical protein